MHPSGTGSFLATLTQPDRVGMLARRFKDLPVAEFVCLLDFITAEFQQCLSAFDLVNNAALEQILEQILDALTFKIGLILRAEQTTIFLVDHDKNELWARLPDGDDRHRERRIPLQSGITGLAATTNQIVNATDAPNHPHFHPDYDTYGPVAPRNLLCCPVRSSNGGLNGGLGGVNSGNGANGCNGGQVVAVVQLLNRIDAPAFDRQDEARFQEFATSIGIILESSQSFYAVARNQRGVAALLKAMTCFSQSLDLDRTLQAVMDEARDLMQAEASNLFLLDRETGTLQATFGGDRAASAIPLGRGIAGRVATDGIAINTSDAESHPYFDPAVDAAPTGHTRALLCMPIFNPEGALIGVSQLVNRQQGSFTASDEAFMRALNTQAGIALENARLFETVLIEQQYQKDILRSLSNAVISTDMEGSIVTVNEAALEMLGCRGDRDRWQQYLLGRPVWEIVPIDLLRMRLQDSLNTGARHFVPEQTLRVALYRPHGTDPNGPTVPTLRDGDRHYPWDRPDGAPLPESALEFVEHSFNLSVTPLTNPEGQARGGLVVLEDISREKRMKAALYRYMTPGVAERALQMGEAALGSGERRDVTVLFSDIRGYTGLAEQLGPSEVVALLNAYFETMVEAVFNWNGTLDKFIGDALMAVFGAPLPLEDSHAFAAVCSALEMRDRLKAFNEQSSRRQYPPIAIGIGICSGDAIVGNIGSQRRMEYTTIGDTVNVSARLESLTKEYGCSPIVSESTYNDCRDRVWGRELDRLRVKGKSKPVRIYEILDLKEKGLGDRDRRFLDSYEKGRQAYNKFHFQQALIHFAAAQSLRPKDPATRLYIQRSTTYLDCPPPEYWEDLLENSDVQ